jgi:hypothetical protein
VSCRGGLGVAEWKMIDHKKKKKNKYYEAASLVGRLGCYWCYATKLGVTESDYGI